MVKPCLDVPRARRRVTPAARKIGAVAVAAAIVACGAGEAREPDVQVIHFTAAGGDTIVVNNERPVRLPRPGGDAPARAGFDNAVFFDPIATREVELTAPGLVTCRHFANVDVRAHVAGRARVYTLLCRPVHIFYLYGSPVQFVLGESVAGMAPDTPKVVNVYARGPDNEPVTRLSGTLTVPNAHVARGTGLTITPQGIGSTLIDVRVGDHDAGQGVYVFERVTSLASLRPDQRHVALPVTLAPGESRLVTIPPGTWKLIMAPAGDSARGVQYRVEGAACEPTARHIVRSIFCFARDSFDVRFTRPRNDQSTRPLVGELRLQRQGGA